MITKREIFLNLFWVGIVIFFVFRSCSQQKQKESAQSINDVLTEQFKATTNKLGQETATRQVIMASYSDLKKVHANDSSELGRLQKLVDSKTLSATIVGNITSVHDHGKTTVTFVHDSLHLPLTGPKMPCDTVYPMYTYKDSTKWQQVSVKATKDSTDVLCLVHNEFEISQKFVKKGTWPFRKKVPEISILNLNPNTKTTEVISYHVQPPKTYTPLIIGVTALIGFIAGAYLTK